MEAEMAELGIKSPEAAADSFIKMLLMLPHDLLEQDLSEEQAYRVLASFGLSVWQIEKAIRYCHTTPNDKAAAEWEALSTQIKRNSKLQMLEPEGTPRILDKTPLKHGSELCLPRSESSDSQRKVLTTILQPVTDDASGGASEPVEWRRPHSETENTFNE